MQFKKLRSGHKFVLKLNGMTYVKLCNDPVGFKNVFFLCEDGFPCASSLDADLEVDDLGEALLFFK